MSVVVPVQVRQDRRSDLDTVAGALADIRAGRPVIVVDDDEDRENEGDLIMAAEHATTQALESGISAADRAHTLRLLADPDATPGQFCRPGHVFPLRARTGGLAERRGHTEAAVEQIAAFVPQSAAVR